MAGQRAAAPEKKREKGGVRRERAGAEVDFSTLAKRNPKVLLSF